MINTVDLFNKYKDEKALVIGSLEVRTGLEDFPSWFDWKVEYQNEYAETHMTVSVEEADKMMDNIVSEAEDELGDVQFEKEAKEKDDEDDVPEGQRKIKPINWKKALAARNPKKVAAVKAKAKAKAKPNAAVKAKPSKKSNKTILARALFVANFGKIARKEVIALFVADAGMTPAGASTYYAKFKNEQ